MKSYIFLAAALLCNSTTAQTNQGKPNFLNLFEKDQTAIISKSQTIAILYLPPADGNRIVRANFFYSDEPIRFGFISTTNTASTFFILRPEYGFRISARAESGELVAFTDKGAGFGKKFNDINGYDKDAIDTTRSEPPYWSIAAAVDSFPGLSNVIPAPDELFDFKKPGKYVVTIEAACFLSRNFPPNPGSKSTNYYLVKFPPVKLHVVKK